MIEIPEAMVLSEQINEIIAGKQIRNVTTSHSPHKFAWFCGNPEEKICLETAAHTKQK